VKRIEKLTSEQEVLLPQQRDHWIKTGLSTEPADRARAEDGVRKAYRAAGLEPPRVIVWLDSPLAGAYGQALTGMLLTELAKSRPQGQVWDQVRDQVWDQVRDQVGDQVRDQVWDQVRGQVWDQVRDQVGDQVRDQVGDQVWGQVRGQVRDQVGDQVRDQVGDWQSGLIDGYYQHVWSSWVDTMRKLGVENLEPWDGMQQIAESAGWIWVYRGFCILTERPTELHRDAQNRLHCEAGPAVRYRDGFAVHAWHGTRVPADLIETGWDTARIFTERNAEIRRCAIERIGWDEFITQSGMKLISEVDDPGNQPHKISLWDLPDKLDDLYEEPARILLCTNGSVERDGTRRRFGLPVPAHHKDPISAAADLYDWPVEAYRRLEVRR
jgi:hypothetical protein